MITIFHVADIHFGVENYGKIDQKTGIHSRLLDFKHALEQCIDQAIEEKIDLFLLCGDAYKSAYPTPTQQKLLLESLLKLHAAKIPVVIVIGNHDHPLSFGKAHALDLLDYLPLNTFHVFSKPNYLTITTNHGPLQIVGVPWPTRNTLLAHQQHHLKEHTEITSYISEKVGQVIQSLAQELDPSLPAILAGHLTVSSGIFSGSEKTAIFGSDPIFLPSQLAIKPFDYVALGHLHRYQNIHQKGSIPIVYSGSIERIDFGERKEEKGFCRIHLTSDKKCEYDFVPIKTRPMIQFDIMLEQEKDQTKQILEHLQAKDISDAIVKIVYHVPEGAQDTVDLYAVQLACKKAAYLAGIFPVHKIAPRPQRAQLKVDMDLKTLVTSYFETKQEFSDEKKGLLIQKALHLHQTIDQQ
ncbi:MAG: exonuclease subunit SbcD [bacterium]